MRNGLLSTVGTLLLGAGWALAQGPGDPHHVPPGPVLPGTPFPLGAPPPGYPGGPLPAPPPVAEPVPAEGWGMKWLRNNAFGPRFTPFSERNAFGPHRTLPEELEDNAYCATPPHGIGHDPWVWCGFEYIFWVLRNEEMPGAQIISTSAPTLGMRPPLFQLGNTQIILQNVGADSTRHSGARFTFGFWVVPSHLIGVEGNVFTLEPQSEATGIGSDALGTPLIAPPNVNALFGVPGTFLPVAFPLRFAGGADIKATTEFWGTEGNVVINLGSPSHRSVFLLGFRYLNLEDEYHYNQFTQVLDGGIGHFQGLEVGSRSILTIQDIFRTTNEYRGGQIGFRCECDKDRLFCSLAAKLGFGSTKHTLDVAGLTTVRPPSLPVLNVAGGYPLASAVGGLLATRSNIGLFTENNFSFVPEVNLKVGCHITPGWHVFVGYDFLYWTKVVRPAGVLNPVINPTQVPTSPSFFMPVGPEMNTTFMRQSDFWVHGFNLGLNIEF
jgi:hypothetical protein